MLSKSPGRAGKQRESGHTPDTNIDFIQGFGKKTAFYKVLNVKQSCILQDTEAYTVFQSYQAFKYLVKSGLSQSLSPTDEQFPVPKLGTMQ